MHLESVGYTRAPLSAGAVICWSIAISLLSWLLVEPLPFEFAPQMRPLLTPVRWAIGDALIRLRARHSAPHQIKAPIVIIAIDDRSLERLGPPPVDRHHYTKLLNYLRVAHARVVAFDLLFPKPSPYDAEFAEAIKRAGNVILAAAVSGVETSVHLPYKLAKRVCISPKRLRGRVTSIVGLELPTESLLQVSYGMGIISIFLDDDGTCRRLPLVLKYNELVLPSFPLAVVSAYHGIAPAQLRGIGRRALWIGEHRIPVQSAPSWFGWGNDFVLGIAFHQRANNRLVAFTSFPTFSLVDVLDGKVPKDALKGRIVLIGATSLQLSDFRPTPIHAGTTGVNILAHAIDTIMSGEPIKEASSWLHFLLTLCVGIATGVIIFHHRALVGLLWAGNVLAASFVVPYGCLKIANVLINPLGALIGWALCSIIIATVKALYAERRAEHLTGLLSLYVAPQVAKQLAHSSDVMQQLAGRKKVVTTIFTDIRGFTTTSQALPPFETVSLLSHYFTVMSEIVFLYGGMVNNLMGDGMMALFGVLPDRPDHAQRGVLAAWHMLEELEELQFEWEQITGAPLRIGIGVNTGEAVVGDIRTPYKGHYTAIGASVNMAQRLEQLTKELNHPLLIGEATYREVEHLIIAEPIKMQLRGIEHPVTVYKVLGLSEDGKHLRRSYWVLNDMR